MFFPQTMDTSRQVHAFSFAEFIHVLTLVVWIDVDKSIEPGSSVKKRVRRSLKPAIQAVKVRAPGVVSFFDKDVDLSQLAAVTF